MSGAPEDAVGKSEEEEKVRQLEARVQELESRERARKRQQTLLAANIKK